MRDVRQPIALLTTNPASLERALQRVRWYLLADGPQCVFLDVTRRVYAVPEASDVATRWCEDRGDFVGRFAIKRPAIADACMQLLRIQLTKRFRALRQERCA